MVRAELIIKEFTTQGSGPLLVLADNGKLYVAKTTTYPVPCAELINEIVCGYLAMCWGLKVPPMALVSISQSLADRFQQEVSPLSKRYARCDFENRLFFGSEIQTCSLEFDEYFAGPTHPSQIKMWNKPVDILKIGAFDLWIGNFDRKPENPNILLADRVNHKADFCPIDHTAAFGHLSNYREVRKDTLHMDPKKSILSHQFVKSITNFVARKEMQALPENILTGMHLAISNLDWIFDQVPKEWGLSKKVRAHLKEVLSDEARNERIAINYHHYL